MIADASSPHREWLPRYAGALADLACMIWVRACLGVEPVHCLKARLKAL